MYWKYQIPTQISKIAFCFCSIFFVFLFLFCTKNILTCNFFYTDYFDAYALYFCNTYIYIYTYISLDVDPNTKYIYYMLWWCVHSQNGNMLVNAGACKRKYARVSDIRIVCFSTRHLNWVEKDSTNRKRKKQWGEKKSGEKAFTVIVKKRKNDVPVGWRCILHARAYLACPCAWTLLT